jgi:hypothetical protein
VIFEPFLANFVELRQREVRGIPLLGTANFAGQPNVLVYLAAAGLVGMVAVFPTAGEFGKRSRATPGSDEPAVSGQP